MLWYMCSSCVHELSCRTLCGTFYPDMCHAPLTYAGFVLVAANQTVAKRVALTIVPPLYLFFPVRNVHAVPRCVNQQKVPIMILVQDCLYTDAIVIVLNTEIPRCNCAAFGSHRSTTSAKGSCGENTESRCQTRMACPGMWSTLQSLLRTPALGGLLPRQRPGYSQCWGCS